MRTRMTAARIAPALALIAALGVTAGTTSASAAVQGARGRPPAGSALTRPSGPGTSLNEGCQFQVDANISIRNAPDGTAIQSAPDGSFFDAAPEEYDNDGQTWFFGIDQSNNMVGWVGEDYLGFLDCLGPGEPDQPGAAGALRQLAAAGLHPRLQRLPGGRTLPR